MSRQTFLRAAALGGIATVFPGARAVAAVTAAMPVAVPEFTPLDIGKEQWRARLPGDRYRVLFEEDTEPSHSSPLNEEKRDGTFVCAACALPLFDSSAKFDSGTGWPSFFQPIAPRVVGTKRDFKLIWPRTEYHCARCGGHQGHVFDDGPKPTGQRWCNNGLALEFVARGTPLPALVTP